MHKIAMLFFCLAVNFAYGQVFGVQVETDSAAHNAQYQALKSNVCLGLGVFGLIIAFGFYERLRSNKKQKKKLEEAYEELKSAYRQINLLSRRDQLTKLSSRLDILEKIEYELHRSQRLHTSFALVFIDIAGFREINMQYGMECGDIVLSLVGNMLAANARTSDYLGRFEKDIFILLLTDTNPQGVACALERLLLHANNAECLYQNKKISYRLIFGGKVVTSEQYSLADAPVQSIVNNLISLSLAILSKAKNSRQKYIIE